MHFHERAGKRRVLALRKILATLFTTLFAAALAMPLVAVAEETIGEAAVGVGAPAAAADAPAAAADSVAAHESDFEESICDLSLLCDGGYNKPRLILRNLRPSLLATANANAAQGDVDGFSARIREAVEGWDGSEEIQVSDLSSCHIDSEIATKLIRAVCNEPRYFYLSRSMSITSSRETGYVSRVKLAAYSSRYTVADRSAYEEKVQFILDQVNWSWSDEQKALFIHDYLATHCHYDVNYKNHSAFDGL